MFFSIQEIVLFISWIKVIILYESLKIVKYWFFRFHVNIRIFTMHLSTTANSKHGMHLFICVTIAYRQTKLFPECPRLHCWNREWRKFAWLSAPSPSIEYLQKILQIYGLFTYPLIRPKFGSCYRVWIYRI